MSIKKIFVACGFTWNNKGDAALLMATAQALRKAVPQVGLSFVSFTPELDSQRYDEKVVCMPLDPGGRASQFTHRFGNASPSALRLLVSMVLLFFRVWLVLRRFMPESVANLLLGRRMLPTVREIMTSDIVVALPGGYLQATEWRDDFWLFHWLTLQMAKAAGKPVVIYAQSIGPFEGRHRRWAEDLLRKIDVVSVREEFSLQRLKEYGISEERTVLVPDAAFGLGVDGCGSGEIESITKLLNVFPQPWVGISVREHHFPGKDDSKVWMEKYLTEVARVADSMVELTKGAVFFVPQCILTGGQDVEVSREVVKRMQHADYARVVDEDLSPLALQVLYSRFEMLIGTRMHANILSMCAGTPVVAIAYERKTNGIMEMLGLGEYVVNIEDVEGRLLPLVERVFASRQKIKLHLAKTVSPIRARAQATPTILFEKLQGLAP